MLYMTPDERQALQMLADGTATDAIADRLGMSEREVEVRLSALCADGCHVLRHRPGFCLPPRTACLVDQTDGQPPSDGDDMTRTRHG